MVNMRQQLGPERNSYPYDGLSKAASIRGATSPRGASGTANEIVGIVRHHATTFLLTDDELSGIETTYGCWGSHVAAT